MLCKVNVKHCRWGNTPSLPWRLEVAASHWRDATPSAQRGRWEKQKSMQQNADNSLNETHCQSQEISARQQNKTKHEAKSTQKWFQNNTVCSWSPELVSGRCCSLHPHATWQSLSSFAKCGEECSVIMSLSSLFFFFIDTALHSGTHFTASLQQAQDATQLIGLCFGTAWLMYH